MAVVFFIIVFFIVLLSILLLSTICLYIEKINVSNKNLDKVKYNFNVILELLFLRKNYNTKICNKQEKIRKY